MKTKLTYLFYFVIIAMFFYGLFSFYFLSISPYVWADGGRYFFTMFIFLDAIAAIMAYNIEKTNQ